MELFQKVQVINKHVVSNISSIITHTNIASSTFEVMGPIISTVPESHIELQEI